MLEHEHALRFDLDASVGRSAPRARPPPGPRMPRARRSRRRAAGAKTGHAADGAGAVLAARRRSGRGARRTAPPGHHAQRPDAGSRHDRRGDGPGLADRVSYRVSPAARAADAGAARGDRRYAALHGAGTDRPDESLDRFAQRSLRARRHSVRNADRHPAVYRTRSDGMGALPHCPTADPAGRTPRGPPSSRIRNHHAAARQDGRGALPDGGRRRTRSPAVSDAMGRRAPHR